MGSTPTSRCGCARRSLRVLGRLVAMDPIMDIGSTDAGGVVSVVVDVMVFDPNHERHLVRLLHTGGVAQVCGLLEGDCAV